jgi:hypothetical protein
MAARTILEERQRPAPGPRRTARTLQWLIVVAASALAWALFMIGAVVQREFLVLLFPAGWCAYVAIRQFRLITRGGAPGSP